MKKKVDFRIPIIIILTIILIVMLYFYFKDDNYTDFSKMNENFNSNSNFDFSFNNNNNKTILSTTSEIKSSLIENIELHATYYLEESYIKINETIKSGENILKYTNGKYLAAPYDCVITNINIPNEEEQCTNEYYIEISSINNMQVQFGVDEKIVDSIKIGQEATIEIRAYGNKILQGYVTKISSTASKGKFTVTVEFENDGEILLGMTADVKI